MKRLRILLYFCILILVTSCSSSFVSKSKFVEFRGNPSTGYSWDVVVDDTGLVDVDCQVINLGDQGLVGTPALYNFEIKTLKAGEGEINFIYHRPWLEDSTIESIKYKVAVKKDGGLKLKKL